MPEDPCQGNACGIATRRDVQANGDRLEQLNALLQGVDLSLLAIMNGKLDAINGKLGPQVPGGLSGLLNTVKSGLDKFYKWSQLGRVLQVFTFVATLHNAYMLSNALTQTLFSMFSNVLAVFGIDDTEGNPLNIGEIVGDTIEKAAERILGVETVDGIQATWKKYSRIYQAAANIINSFQSIGYSILSALEVIGSMNAKIGNALQKYGVVAERAFGWMNPQPNFQNRFFTAIQNTSEIVESIDQVASEILSARETVEQLTTQREELETAVREGLGPNQPENSTTANAATQQKSASQSPAISPEDEVKPED